MANVVNQFIDKGADVTLSVNVYVSNAIVNLSTYTASASFRKHYDSANSIAFTCNGYANGLLTMTLTASQTANIEGGKYVYDAKITSSANVVTRVIEGILTIKENVV